MTWESTGWADLGARCHWTIPLIPGECHQPNGGPISVSDARSPATEMTLSLEPNWVRDTFLMFLRSTVKGDRILGEYGVHGREGRKEVSDLATEYFQWRRFSSLFHSDFHSSTPMCRAPVPPHPAMILSQGYFAPYSSWAYGV